MTTIRDVARASGVSIATVSRAINGTTRVNDETYRRVMDAASRLDYWPNGAARMLTTGRTSAIGVLLPDLHGEFFSEVIRGIDRAAVRHRVQILISSSHADTEGLLAAARTMGGRVDGLIVMAPERGASSAIDQIRRRFPMVLMNPRHLVRGRYSVSIANSKGACKIARHVLALGHERIAIVKGPEGNIDAEERLRGYRRALREARIPSSAVLEIPGDFSRSAGQQAARRILRRRQRPTAIFAANDYMAMGVLETFGEEGVQVPGEAAVTGFDDILIAQYLTPPLTTVRVDACEMGEKAVQLLMAATRLGDRVPAPNQKLPATLVVRESCGFGKAPAGGVRKATRRRK